MYKKLQSSELKKFITDLRLSSVIVQITYLAMPLSMYLVYNRAIANQNLNTVNIILLFLAMTMCFQYLFRKMSAIQQSILKTDDEINKHEQYIKYRFFNSKNIEYVNTYADIFAEGSNNFVTSTISRTYYYMLYIYFVLIMLIGKFLVLAPLLLFIVCRKIIRTLSYKINDYKIEYNEISELKANLTKETLAKLKIINGLKENDYLYKILKEIADRTNLLKCSYLYMQNVINNFSMIINILNVSFILVLGRYLYSLDILTMGDIITCSILTVWIARPMSFILINTNNDTDYKQFYIEDSNENTEKKNTLKNFQYNNILTELDKGEVAYFNENDGHAADNIYKELNAKYGYTYLIDNEDYLFYGTVLDNITLFNKEKYSVATIFINKFNLDNLIMALPYQFNYVITGDQDQIVPFDLKVGIALTRCLLAEPRNIILNIDVNRIKFTFLQELFKYCKAKKIKIVCKKCLVKPNKIIALHNNEKQCG